MPTPLDPSSSVPGLNRHTLLSLTKRYDTPFWCYDASTIRSRVSQLSQFDIIRYAQKANPNIHILRLLRPLGVKLDAVSHGEIARALIAGYDASEVVYTSDVLDTTTLKRVTELGITVNCGSIDMLRQLPRGHKVWIRINPGFGSGHNRRVNTGGEDSKNGIWHMDVPDALSVIRERGLCLEGVHMHIGSGADYSHLQKVCDSMVNTIKSYNIDIKAISAGGGLSVPYRYGEKAVDVQHYLSLWDNARKKIEDLLGHTISLEIEPGRFIVAESGVLVAQVRAVKNMGNRHYVLCDAGFSELLRPALYGAYHEISVMCSSEHADNGDYTSGGAEDMVDTVVAGPLCESGDVFTQSADGEVLPRSLPKCIVGDYLVFHNAGAYGSSMSSGYNSRALVPELLIDNRTVREIRRRQTVEEMLKIELEAGSEVVL